MLTGPKDLGQGSHHEDRRNGREEKDREKTRIRVGSPKCLDYKRKTLGGRPWAGKVRIGGRVSR